MNRYLTIFLIVLLSGILLSAHAGQPLVSQEPSAHDSIPQVQVDTLPTGFPDSLYRPLYQEYPLVRPINHIRP